MKPNEYCIWYAYPSSENAKEHNHRMSGCYIVAIYTTTESYYESSFELYANAYAYAKSFSNVTANVWCISQSNMHNRLIGKPYVARK